ncbi:hypothetical protein BCON_0031g00160 [Botryotinia convoluta]|uniref:Uncharacterized protein n=1 Tax=Botryotinia convoluta TaxID=54673 RepID=A0A4Z1IH21_9HELO|nr:hypothetical protein BCON_0031g00160 [Botryotinia convoluta]
MSSANLEKRPLKRKSSPNLNGEYSQHQADASGLDYGSPARSTKVPNFSQGHDTEKEETKVDIDEAMRRRRVANEETDEIVETLKKKVDTSKERISALEAKVKDQEAEIKKLKEFNNRLRRENNGGKLKSKVPTLERELEDKNAEIGGLQKVKSRLEDLVRDEEARTEQKSSEAKTFEKEKAEQAQNYQALQEIVVNLKERTQEAIYDKERFLLESSKQKTETNALTTARQNLTRDLDKENQNLSSEIENGKILQSKITAEIARTQELREEKHTLKSELEEKKKLLDTLRASFRAIAAFANDEPLAS